MRLHNLFNTPKKKITESVIYQVNKENPMDDTEVSVLGGAGRYTLQGLRDKARREAKLLASDLEANTGDSFRRSARNVEQLTNTLNTITAAYDELNKMRSKGGVNSRGMRQEDLDLVEDCTVLLNRAGDVVRSDDTPRIVPSKPVDAPTPAPRSVGGGMPYYPDSNGGRRYMGDSLQEGIAIPGNQHWQDSVALGKEHVADGSSAESLYNQHQNVPQRHFYDFVKAVGAKFNNPKFEKELLKKKEAGSARGLKQDRNVRRYMGDSVEQVSEGWEEKFARDNARINKKNDANAKKWAKAKLLNKGHHSISVSVPGYHPGDVDVKDYLIPSNDPNDSEGAIKRATDELKGYGHKILNVKHNGYRLKDSGIVTEEVKPYVSKSGKEWEVLDHEGKVAFSSVHHQDAQDYLEYHWDDLRDPAKAISEDQFDFVHMNAKVFVKGNEQAGFSTEPLEVVGIVDDQRVVVRDDYGNKQTVFITDLVPADSIAETSIDQDPAKAISEDQFDFVHMHAKVFVKGNEQAGFSTEPLEVVGIVDDQRVVVRDDYGNKQTVFITDLVPADSIAETSIDQDPRSFIIYDKNNNKILQIDVTPRDLPLAIQYAQNAGYDAGYKRQNANHFKGEYLDEAGAVFSLGDVEADDARKQQARQRRRARADQVPTGPRMTKQERKGALRQELNKLKHKMANDLPMGKDSMLGNFFDESAESTFGNKCAGPFASEERAEREASRISKELGVKRYVDKTSDGKYIVVKKKGVTEGSEYQEPALGTIKATLMNTAQPTVQVQVYKHNALRGDSYWVTKEVKQCKTIDQANAYIDRINKQSVAEQATNKKTWEVCYDYGPHMSDTVTVKAENSEAAKAAGLKIAKKKYSNIMLNWVRQKEVDESKRTYTKKKKGKSLIKLAIAAMALKWALSEGNEFGGCGDCGADADSPEDLNYTECCGRWLCDQCSDAHDAKWHQGDDAVTESNGKWIAKYCDRDSQNEPMEKTCVSKEKAQEFLAKLPPHYVKALRPASRTDESAVAEAVPTGFKRKSTVLLGRNKIFVKNYHTYSNGRPTWYGGDSQQYVTGVSLQDKGELWSGYEDGDHDQIVAKYQAQGYKVAKPIRSFKRNTQDKDVQVNEITKWDTTAKKGSPGLLGDIAWTIKYSTLKSKHNLGNGYTLEVYDDDGSGEHFYYVTRDANNKLTAYIELLKNRKAFSVHGVYATSKHNYPMYKVYAYIVKRLGITLMSDTVQSDAGQAVWTKLSAEPGITVFGWNTKTRKAINLGDKLDHDTEGDTHTGETSWDSGETYSLNPDPSAKDVVLVAIKK